MRSQKKRQHVTQFYGHVDDGYSINRWFFTAAVLVLTDALPMFFLSLVLAIRGYYNNQTPPASYMKQPDWTDAPDTTWKRNIIHDPRESEALLQLSVLAHSPPL